MDVFLLRDPTHLPRCSLMENCFELSTIIIFMYNIFVYFIIIAYDGSYDKMKNIPYKEGK